MPKLLFQQILTVVGGDALSCQIVLFNLEETSVYNSDDMKIDVSMGCVKIVFLNWFVSSVLVCNWMNMILLLKCKFLIFFLSSFSGYRAFWIISKRRSKQLPMPVLLLQRRPNKIWSKHIQMPSECC